LVADAESPAPNRPFRLARRQGHPQDCQIQTNCEPGEMEAESVAKSIKMLKAVIYH